MTRAFILGMTGLFVVACGFLPAGVPDAVADSITFQAMVVEVKDGDTFIVLRNKTRLTVKLPGVDAPELDQPYGPEAKRFAAKLVKGRVVTIETAQASNPIYGAVRFQKNKILAHEMVRAGLSWATSMDKSSMLAEIQEAAKKARLGLWANSEDEEPVPPWEWRAKKSFQ